MPQSGEVLRNLDSLPSANQRETNRWADYVELRCLTSLDGEVSDADLLDHFRDRRDLGELDDEAAEASNPERTDKEETQLNDIFLHLQYREASLGESYPFSVLEGNILRCDQDSISAKQKLYIFLLLAANLKYVRDSGKVTSSFERISRDVLAKLMPRRAEVHIFGTSASSQRAPRYSGTLAQKVQKLASDLSESVMLQPGSVAPTNTGDGGLDLVAWVPVGDTQPGRLVVFGQCACTTEWVTKQHSSKVDAWRKKMSFTADPVNVVFIPFFFRSNGGDWFADQDIHGGVLMDRMRILELLKTRGNPLGRLPARRIVDDAIAFRLSTY